MLLHSKVKDTRVRSTTLWLSTIRLLVYNVQLTGMQHKR